MSFPAYPSYRASGSPRLGKLPEHWELAPIKAVASWNDDVLTEATPDEFELEYVEISDVQAGQGVVGSTSYTFAEAPSRARRRVSAGDILVSTVRTYLRAIAQVDDPVENLIASTGFAVLRPRRVNTDYLGYAIGAEPTIHEVIARSVGVSYPAINASELVRIAVPLPTAAEQTAIAAFLDRETAKIDTLVEKQRRLIALLKEKRQAVISHAVTKGLDPTVPMKDSGVEWLGNVPAHWEVSRVKSSIVSIEQGWSPQCDATPVGAPEEWGVLKVGCVNGGVFRPSENKSLPADLQPIPALGVRTGDVLVSRANTRELVGSAAVAPADYPRLMLCDKLYRLEALTSKIAPSFLAMFLQSSVAREIFELEATGASSSMVNIGQSVVLEMSLGLPPLAEQMKIVEHVERMMVELSELLDIAQRSTSLLQERRAALIAAAVTGKIDARGLAPQPAEAA